MRQANALWPAAFFGLGRPGLGVAVIVLLWGSIVTTVRVFWPLQRGAAVLLLPYLGWVTFATYLNFGFWWLNRG